MEFYNKHYVRINGTSRVIKGFSTAFEQPIDGDICINERGSRHFELLGVTNPNLITYPGLTHNFICEESTGEGGVTIHNVRETTESERLEEIMSRPVSTPKPTEVELLEQKMNEQIVIGESKIRTAMCDLVDIVMGGM